MKTLLILRHAKTEPDAPNGDHARQLTGRGRRDATTIGNFISSSVGVPDVILTSDASRALETSELVAAGCLFAGDLTVEPDIYGASAEALAGIVRRLPAAAAYAVLVGHNPSMVDLVTLLAGPDVAIDHLPTAGLVHLEHDTDRWAEITPASCRVRGMTSPAMLARE
jgi:phosphohistidine phosphatase